LKLLQESVEVPSRFTEQIGKAAKAANMVVSVGINERDGGTIYNADVEFHSCDIYK
jgi:aliphatic nitrilase